MAENVEIVVTAKDEASQALRGVNDSLGSIGQIAQGVLQGLGQAFFNMALQAIPAAVDAMWEFVDVASQAEEVSRMYQLMLETSPAKDYADALLDVANAQSQVTRFDDEAITAAETILLRYDQIAGDVLPSLTEVTLDYATVMGTDATGAAQTLGRALSDIDNGSLSLLKRSRLLTQEVVDQAEEMAKAGDVAGAQRLIIDSLDKKYGNFAEEMGSTYQGNIERFGNAMDNIKEAIGAPLLNAITPFVEKMAEFAQQILPKVQDFVNGQGLSFLSGQLQRLGDWWKTNGPQIMAIAQVVFGYLKQISQSVGADIKAYLVMALQSFADFLFNNKDTIMAALVVLASAFVKFAQFAAVALRGVLATMLFFQKSIQSSVLFVSKIINGEFLAAFRRAAAVVAATMNSILNNIKSKFQAAASYLTGLRSKFVTLAVAIVKGMEDGLKSAWAGLIATFNGLIDQLPETVKKALGIASPSKVFAAFGKNIAQGLQVGISKNAMLPVSATYGMAQGTVQAMKQTTYNNNYMYGTFNVAGNNGALDITGVR